MSAYRVLAAALFFFSGAVLVTEAARAAQSMVQEKQAAADRAPVTEAVPAANFRVENTVLVVGQSRPQSQGVTIFHEGLVYDFLTDPAEVIVFDKAQRRFLLLDLGRHVRSEISTEYVQEFVNRAQRRLSGDPDPNVRWLAEPSFEETFNHENSQLTLRSSSITYQVRLQTTDAAVAAQYREFSDWYAKFNHVFNPKSRPPFPRMMLNAAIARRQGIAKEVHLTTTLSAKAAPVKVGSRHQLVMELDTVDKNRVAEVRDYLGTFPTVSLTEYRQAK